LSIPATFEARILRSFVEEMIESRIKILQGLLQDYAADILEKGPLRGLLQLCQGKGGRVIVHRLLFLLVGLRAQLERPIPDKTRAAESLSKLLFLGSGRKEAIFEGFLSYHSSPIMPYFSASRRGERYGGIPTSSFISAQTAARLWIEYSFAPLIRRSGAV
jgi:hypothetical protein